MELKDKIWLTRKCRIEASERLNRFDLISKVILIYYSTFILSISIYSLMISDSRLSFSLTVGSLLVLIASLFIASRNFKERSILFKQCYIRLDQLIQSYGSKDKIIDDHLIQKLSDEYFNILNLTENHSEYDYLRVKVKLKSDNEGFKITTGEKVNLFLLISIRLLFVASLFLLPILSLFYSI